MAHYKEKQVKKKETPTGNIIRIAQNPDSYYDIQPSWCFQKCDKEKWAFSENNGNLDFFGEILPKLKEYESQKWRQILIDAKKQNHSIPFDSFNKCARDRLIELRLEPESIISLRLNGTHRLYGFIINGVFNILWYDHNHGNNESCVCRSNLKHT